jgi:spore maturation protein CgeB
MDSLSKRRIVYIGRLDQASNALRRMKTLQQMGHDVTPIHIDPYLYTGLFEKFHHHLNIGPGILKLNREVLRQCAAHNPDLLWVDNKSFLQRATLLKLRKVNPAIRIIQVITDDLGARPAAWRLTRAHASCFDVHFVQRVVNINELYACGARRVAICHRSYDPDFHRPIVLSEEDKRQFHTPVGFIGTHEAEREAMIVFLIKQGIPVQVTGNDWPGKKYWSVIRPYYQGPSVYGEDYIKRINGMDIALHFLRHGNRDEQDSRTFEIPACGVFMLAERSELHQQLFEANTEAVFFDNREELLQRIIEYKQRPDERARIAAAGRNRCIQSGYSHEGRLTHILKTIYPDGSIPE